MSVSSTGDKKLLEFSNKILQYYLENGRPMPWRDNTSAYSIFISEVMLQQTQVSRVLDYYNKFLNSYPDFESLASADLSQLLARWKGLGYNRRAGYLRDAARMVVGDYGGKLPADTAELVKLPGIGKNTAGSIAAFAFNIPAIFIETNIRRVFLHEFFPDELEVGDDKILPILEKTVSREQPRLWYWGIMDYGVSLKQEGRSANRRSRHHVVQSPFEGSRRQLRATMLYTLQEGVLASEEQLNTVVREKLPAHPYDARTFSDVLSALCSEGYAVHNNGKFSLAD